MAYRFEIHKDKTGQFRVRFKYSGEIIFSTEAYTTKASAQKAIRSIKENGPAAPIEDLTLAAAKSAAAKPAAAKVPAKTSAKAPAKSSSAKDAAKPAEAPKAAATRVRAAAKTAAKTSATSNP